MTQGRRGIIGQYPSQYRVVSRKKFYLVVACFVLSFALPAIAQIRGSAHDFSSYGWSEDELCAVCHLSHTQTVPTAMAPLWNHEISSAGYTLYKSSTLSQTPTQPDSMNISRLCLSCHDGTVALDSFGGRQGANYIPEAQSLGTDLSDDHPIGVSLVRRLDGDGAPPANGVKFYAGKVECPSCHDVHNNQVSDEKLLRVARTGSALCFQCHDK